MYHLHPDPNFHYEVMRAIGTVPYHGADITEILSIMPLIVPGDFESWYKQWFALAQRVLSTLKPSFSPVTKREIYFRASHYIFVADFFLHGKGYKDDPRVLECYELWRKYFDLANELLAIPGKRVEVASEEGDFRMPVMVFRAEGASKERPRPTLLVGGGFESNMEETFHVFGFAALERGYNVVIYEGPGHRTLVQMQGKGFIAEWERAVTPIVDYLLEGAKSGELGFIDPGKIGLVGMSLGGYLAARAAAFEPRLAAVMCIDGVYSFLECVQNAFPPGKSAWDAGDVDGFDKVFEEGIETADTNRRWFHDDLKFTFCQEKASDCYRVCEKMTLAGGVAERIKMPAFIGDAKDDIFFEGQPQRVVEAIGKHATLKEFTEEQGAQLHCQSGALVYLNQEMLEWFAGVVGH